MRGQVKIYQKKIVSRRRRKAFLLTFYSLGGLALILSGLSFASQLDAISIEKVSVEGNVRTSSVDIENKVSDKISGNYFKFFSMRNTFLFPKTDIENSLLMLSSVKSVEVSRRGLQTLVVSIREREESALWCSDATFTNCYLMDDQGTIFSATDTLCGSGSCPDSASSQTRYVYRGILSDDPVGKNFLPVDDFKKIQFFMREIDILALKPVEAEVFDTGYMTIALFDGGKILVNTKDNLTKVLANLSAVISDKTLAPNLSQFLLDLEYLKLSEGNKMVYKMKSSTKISE